MVSSSRTRIWSQALALGGLSMVGAIGLILLGPLADWFSPASPLRGELAALGWAAPAAYIVGAAVLTAVGAPRLVLCSMAGMVFGPWLGLLWSQMGTLIGAYVAFALVRVIGRGPILAHFPRLAKFSRRLESRGLFSVLVIRQIPISGFYNNLLLGLSPVTHFEFFMGSFFGFLPLGGTAVLIGAGVVQAEWSRSVQFIAAGAVVFLMIGFVSKRMVRKRVLPDRELAAGETTGEYDPSR